MKVGPFFHMLCLQDRESQKLLWLQRCVEEMSNEKWSIPALKQMREICLLYVEVCRHHTAKILGHIHLFSEEPSLNRKSPLDTIMSL